MSVICIAIFAGKRFIIRKIPNRVKLSHRCWRSTLYSHDEKCTSETLIYYIYIDFTNFFVASTNTQTRGNSCKLKKNHILNIRDANMFHNRVINFWNKLPDSVVLAASTSSFKRQLWSFVVNVGFEHFSVN